MIDVVGRLRVQVADRIVADGRQMQNRVKADEIADLDVAHVLADRLDLPRRLTQRAGGEQIEVQTDHVVAGLRQQRGHHGADVAVVTGDEYAHSGGPQLSGDVVLDGVAADALQINVRGARLLPPKAVRRGQHQQPVLVTLVVAPGHVIASAIRPTIRRRFAIMHLTAPRARALCDLTVAACIRSDVWLGPP